MTDWENIYETKQKFLNAVREAFREAKKTLTDDEFEKFRYSAQDDLSLFSPWFNT